MNKIKFSTAIVLVFMIGSISFGNIHTLSAQSTSPAILSIFNKYGYRSGVTLLEANDDLIKEYKISLFKSIMFDDGAYALNDIRNCIEKDKKGAIKIKEVIQDGKVQNGYYRLKTDSPNLNRYIIFKVGKYDKVTLIFIEGGLTPEELVKLLQ